MPGFWNNLREDPSTLLNLGSAFLGAPTGDLTGGMSRAAQVLAAMQEEKRRRKLEEEERAKDDEERQLRLQRLQQQISGGELSLEQARREPQQQAAREKETRGGDLARQAVAIGEVARQDPETARRLKGMLGSPAFWQEYETWKGAPDEEFDRELQEAKLKQMAAQTSSTRALAQDRRRPDRERASKQWELDPHGAERRALLSQVNSRIKTISSKRYGRTPEEEETLSNLIEARDNLIEASPLAGVYSGESDTPGVVTLGSVRGVTDADQAIKTVASPAIQTVLSDVPPEKRARYQALVLQALTANASEEEILSDLEEDRAQGWP